MGRGTSQSQNPSATTSRPGLMAPRGSAAASAGMRRRRLGGGSSSSASTAGGGGASAGGNVNMLRFYTDESPGVKIGPTVVLIMSLCFIAFVATLHVIGKLYRVRSGPA